MIFCGPFLKGILLAGWNGLPYHGDVPIVVEISDSVAEGLHLPESEVSTRLRCELAAALYQRELLALGKSAELAGLSRENFAVELARRKIHRHYSKADASLDEAYAGR